MVPGFTLICEMSEYNENDLIDSNLSQSYTRGGKTVQIEIYRLPDTLWTIEVTDQFGNSTVWDKEFETDAEALACALKELEEDGIDEFIGLPGK